MRVGFIGTGNMGGALARAVAAAGHEAWLCDRDEAKAEALAKVIGGKTATVDELIEGCDFLFLGVKPQGMKGLLTGLKERLAAAQKPPVLVSMAAGLSTDSLLDMVGLNLPLIRIMPNTPVAVGEGMVLYCGSVATTPAMLADFAAVLERAGKLSAIPERLIDAASAVAGCGPAFVALFVEALADGGVECGLPRQQALELVVQTVLGTARQLQVTESHPGALKDAVCSPGGSTIAGVHALEEGAFRATTTQAVCAAYARTLELGK